MPTPHAPLPSPLHPPGKSTLEVAAAVGLFGTLIGGAILLAGCAGVDAALVLCPVPIFLGGLGLALTLVAVSRRPAPGPDSLVLAAFFAAGFCLLGGLTELALWLGLAPFNRPGL